MNLHCSKNLCDNNTGFTQECMFGITEDIIRKAKEENSMCPILRNKVMELYDEVAKYIVSEIAERLEEEATKNMRTYESHEEYGEYDLAQKYYEISFAYSNAIDICKEVGGMNGGN